MSLVAYGEESTVKELSFSEQQAKINEVRKALGLLPEKLSIYCSDASISRYLRARNWHVKKAIKMLKASLKWRLEYKPEEIKWEEIAHEADTGKIYRSNYLDKHGRIILVLRPGSENSRSTKGKIRYLCYCLENAIMNLSSDQEQLVWLIDFQGFSMSNVSIKVTHETAHVLQDHYPERLGMAILYNPPKIFEPFWMMVKPFLELKTFRKVKFVYSDNDNSKKIMVDLFDMDKLESAFGGSNHFSFNINDYAKMMRDDDKRMSLYWTQKNSYLSSETSIGITIASSNFCNSESESDDSSRKSVNNSSHEICTASRNCLIEENSNGQVTQDQKDVQSANTF